MGVCPVGVVAGFRRVGAVIKAKLVGADGRPTILIGLSGENVTRLVAGEPILFDADQLGFPGNVVVVYGRTEAGILESLRADGLRVRYEPEPGPAAGGGRG